ncbi:uncharacterized protein Dwil_GK19182 [Drosophila willistoni]|uniref:DUF7775 domain-containing protein n=1 Tax=Drosophila willistoni TaxID=7260 RepID=B4NB58_DROWI|nr:uncharacterized protein LOC6647551 [Drosophila willistoni]EDW81022.1 uncharacterized protein Dwil_GK19182 [Drosophila willistoni]
MMPGMRPFLFFFYMLETIMNIILMGYHVQGFLAIPAVFEGFILVEKYLYLIMFYVLTVLTLFASINVCSGNTPYIWNEINRCAVGAIGYIIISIMTMRDAENELWVVLDNEAEKPTHPFYMFMRGQSICALLCGIIYLLHFTIVLDFLLSKSDEDQIITDYDLDKDDVEDDAASNDLIMPVKLYVLGEWFERRLAKYEWFEDFVDRRRLSI